MQGNKTKEGMMTIEEKSVGVKIKVTQPTHI